jgi:hypothetical protein
MTLGKPGQLFVQDLPDLTPAGILRIGDLAWGDPGLVLAPLGQRCSRLEGRPVGNAVQPTAQGRCLPDRTRIASKNEESGLEGILGVRLAGPCCPADVRKGEPGVPIYCSARAQEERNFSKVVFPVPFPPGEGWDPVLTGR